MKIEEKLEYKIGLHAQNIAGQYNLEFEQALDIIMGVLETLNDVILEVKKS